MQETLLLVDARTANSTYPKGGLTYLADSFLVKETFVLSMKFYANNPALRVAAKRYMQYRQTTLDK